MRVSEILGDATAFFDGQHTQLNQLGIDIRGCAISHLAYRATSSQQYLDLRTELEKGCTANVESQWKGRPISKILLREPMDLGDGFTTNLIELIPPPHRRQLKTGFEHTAVVIGDHVEDFAARHRHALHDQPRDGRLREPFYIRHDADGSITRFLRLSLFELVVNDGFRFAGIQHAEI